jgi:hypothetical protein
LCHHRIGKIAHEINALLPSGGDDRQDALDKATAVGGSGAVAAFAPGSHRDAVSIYVFHTCLNRDELVHRSRIMREKIC